MQFQLVDRISAVEPGKSLRGAKLLTLGEEYLGDHFPGFPVLPGVLMLQALAEAGMWLWRLSSDYRWPVIVMREAKNIKYGSFVAPGQCLDLFVEWTQGTAESAAIVLKGKGTVAGQTVVSGQVALIGYRLAEQFPDGWGATQDARLTEHWRQRGAVLRMIGARTQAL
jgi:3-hydroxyacyl-[acyl-carrier-protein] dehydratase